MLWKKAWVPRFTELCCRSVLWSILLNPLTRLGRVCRLWNMSSFRDISEIYRLITALVGSLLLLLPWRRCRIEANGSHVGARVSPEHLMEKVRSSTHVWPWISKCLIYLVFLWVIASMPMATSCLKTSCLWIPTASHLCAVFLLDNLDGTAFILRCASLTFIEAQ